MTMDVARANGGHKVGQVLIEKMISGSNAEIILGVKRHPALGLALMVGRGGSQAEEMAQFETILLPLMDGDLERAFSKLHVTDHPACASLKKACHAVANYAQENQHHLVTLDVNPVMLTTSGEAIATDALIVLGND